MRAREFVREENYGEAANIDWEKFRAGMTALAMDQEELRGYQGVDAIVFLGLMGDPSPRSRPIDIRLQSPARIVVLNAAGVDVLGPVSGMYLDPNHIDVRDYPNKPDFDNRAQERTAIRKDYDIAVSHKNFDPAFDARRTDALDTLAHEARHRGFRILWETPEIMSKIPQPLQDNMVSTRIMHNTGQFRDSYEHLMIYAVSMGTTGNAIGPDKDSFFRSKEEYYKYRRDYKIVEQAAKSYVMSMKVTPGGLAALRNEVDKMTPKDEVIKIVPGPLGAVAVGTTPVKTAAPAAVKAATPVAPAAAVKAATPVAPAAPVAPVAPAASAATPKTYTVQRGDVLGRIAQRFYKGRLSDLLRANPQFTANGRNPNLIFPGDQVVIPG
jgi:LysM repeat protein